MTWFRTITAVCFTVKIKSGHSQILYHCFLKLSYKMNHCVGTFIQMSQVYLY